MKITLQKNGLVYYQTKAKKLRFIKPGIKAGSMIQDLRLQKNPALFGLIQACRAYPSCIVSE